MAGVVRSLGVRQGRTMLPKDRQIASYLFSAKVNYLAHLSVEKRPKAGLITLPLVSLVLSTPA